MNGIGLIAVDSKHQLYAVCDFKDFEPRKGFKCKQYFNEEERSEQ